MAIAGSGNWTPSRQVRLVDGRLEWLGYAQNRPRELIPPIPDAVAFLRRGETVSVDVRAPQMAELHRAIVIERNNRIYD